MYLLVYGTLKKGFALHQHMKGKFLGEAVTVPGYILYNLGWFPGMVREGNQCVIGELWDVDNLDELDFVEGPSYRRGRIDLQFPYENLEVESYFFSGNTENYQKLTKWE